MATAARHSGYSVSEQRRVMRERVQRLQRERRQPAERASSAPRRNRRMLSYHRPNR